MLVQWNFLGATQLKWKWEELSRIQSAGDPIVKENVGSKDAPSAFTIAGED